MTSFPKIARLLKSRDFRLTAKQGSFRRGQLLSIQVRKVASPELKLGLTVSRRYGKAVQRNHFKRLVREAFRLSYDIFPKNIHVNVYPRSAALKATFAEIQQELIELLP